MSSPRELGDVAERFFNPSAPAAKSEKYARPERERRFLLAGLPPGAPIVRTARLVDHYLVGTRLRLRRAVETSGDATLTFHKLTQKIPAPDGGPGLITTIYLSRAEYEMLAALPARTLSKTRHSVPPFGVDVFAAALDGLTLAEVEFDSDEAEHAFVPPSFALAEVTHDVRFTGGRLVETTQAELRAALATFGC